MSEMAMVSEAGTEICVLCREDTGIPSKLPAGHPKRLGSYVEGNGRYWPLRLTDACIVGGT